MQSALGAWGLNRSAAQWRRHGDWRWNSMAQSRSRGFDIFCAGSRPGAGNTGDRRSVEKWRFHDPWPCMLKPRRPFGRLPLLPLGISQKRGMARQVLFSPSIIHGLLLAACWAWDGEWRSSSPNNPIVRFAARLGARRPWLGTISMSFPAAMTQEGFNSTKHNPKHAGGRGLDFGNLAICSRATLDLHA